MTSSSASSGWFIWALLSAVVLIALIFLGERPSLQEWAGTLMVGAGVMVLALK